MESVKIPLRIHSEESANLFPTFFSLIVKQVLPTNNSLGFCIGPTQENLAGLKPILQVMAVFRSADLDGRVHVVL